MADTVTKIASIELKPTAMTLEGSWGSTPQGTHASTMDLYVTDDGKSGFIEWDIPSMERTETIGLMFEGKELTDYDGVMSIPLEAIEFLRQQGYTVNKDFE